MKVSAYLPSSAIFATVLMTGAPVHAAVDYRLPGVPYTQDFNSLPNTPQNTSLGASPIGWTDDNATPGAGNFSIVGWYLYHPLPLAEGGFNGNQRMRIGAGTANTGAFMSWGESGSTDRALGDLGSNTLAPATNAPAGSIYFGLRLSNNTGNTLDSFTLSYDGEQWRDGGVSTPQTMTFAWAVGATSLQDSNATYTAAPGLDFTTPVNTATAGAVDGNTAGRVPILGTVSGLNWAPGSDLWLRWDDINHTGADSGMGIDNLTFTAVPEPGTYALLGLGAAALFLRRRVSR